MPNITSKVKIINTIWQINSGCRVYHRHFVRSLPCFAPIRVLEPSQLSANQNSFALAYNWKVASKYFLCALFILVNAAATMHSSELSQSSVPRGMNACKLHYGELRYFSGKQKHLGKLPIYLCFNLKLIWGIYLYRGAHNLFLKCPTPIPLVRPLFTRKSYC